MGSLEAPALSLRRNLTLFLLAHDYPPNRPPCMEGKNNCRGGLDRQGENSECTVEMSPGFGGRRSEFEPYLGHKISHNSLNLSFLICKLGVKIHTNRLLGASAE